MYKMKKGVRKPKFTGMEEMLDKVLEFFKNAIERQVQFFPVFFYTKYSWPTPTTYNSIRCRPSR
jgi:hypothetical protein